MITPNKVVTLDNSALGHAPAVLKHGPSPIRLSRLYELAIKEFESIDQFILTLDLLFVLGRVRFEPRTGLLIYVD